MKRFLAVLLLTSALSFQASAAGAGKLIDVFLTQTGLEGIILKAGLEDDVARNIRKYIQNSLLSFNAEDGLPNKSQLIEILNSIKGDKRDTIYKRKLLQLLNKDADSLSKKEFVDSVNSLIYLANRYGVKNATVLACAECVTSSLSRHGFLFTFEQMAETNIKQLLESYVPRRPNDLKYFITSKMRALGFGEFGRASRGLVLPSEERTLALFLALAEESSPATLKQRELINAILEISKDSKGNIKLFDSDNAHKLYKLVDDNAMSDGMRDFWIKTLKEANADSSAKSKKEAFFKVLRREAGDKSELNDLVNSLEIQKCFFR